MLTRLYIEALLVDEGQADQVWEAWDKGGGIDDQIVSIAWRLITLSAKYSGQPCSTLKK